MLYHKPHNLAPTVKENGNAQASENTNRGGDRNQAVPARKVKNCNSTI
jgi:hypothetical protein